MSHAQEVIRKHEERLERKARQEGRKEGRKDSLVDVAKKMLQQKFDIEIITQITGLKKEQFMS